MAEARGRDPLTHLAAAAVAYALLAVWWTWPLARHLPDHVVDGVALHGAFGWLAVADVHLNIWALAWDVHALGTAPLSLLDANVFHPAAWALARADHFLGHLPLFAPVYAATHNPVLGHQVALFLCFPLSALAMHAAVRAWTASTPAALVAGLLFGFAPWRSTQLGHLQLQATMYLPLALVAAERVVRRGSGRAWIALVLATGLEALCSVYLAFITALAVTAMAIGAADRARAWRALGVTAVAALLALAAALPYLVLAPASAFSGLGGGGAERIALLGANPLGTFVLRSHPPSTDGYWFLGWSCIVLASAAVVVRLHREEAGVRRGLVLVLVTGWVVSLGYARALPGGGTTLLPLGWLAALVPGFGTFRAPVRLGLGVALAMPALAGLGTAAIARRLGGTAAGALLATVLLVVIAAEFRPGRVPLRAVPVGAELPEVYRWLAAAPRGPVLEVPTGLVDDDYRADVWAVRWESGYQYASTTHWQRLLNGYSAYPPQSFFFLMAIAARLPADDALADLVDLTGLRWLVVHRAALTPAERVAWERDLPSALVPRATLGDDLVFEVSLPPRTDLVGLLLDERPRPTTLRGLARAPLPPTALHGALRDVELASRVLPGLPVRGRLTVQNDSPTAWPGFDPDRRGLVGIAYRWRSGDVTVPGLVTTRLAHDLAPGESMRIPFSVVAPERPGRWELVLTLRQHDGPWFDEAAGIAVVRPVVVGADDGA